MICKQWIIDVHELIHQHNLDCKQVAWVHGEIQIETRKEHADELGKLAAKQSETQRKSLTSDVSWIANTVGKFGLKHINSST